MPFSVAAAYETNAHSRLAGAMERLALQKHVEPRNCVPEWRATATLGSLMIPATRMIGTRTEGTLGKISETLNTYSFTLNVYSSKRKGPWTKIQAAYLVVLLRPSRNGALGQTSA